MKIAMIRVKDVPPVAYFETKDLSDVVVIAGPNGVGKTRLIKQLLSHLQNPAPNAQVSLTIQATCDEERQAWEADMISTQDQAGTAHLQQTLQKNRFRRNWRSSVLNFDSDRSIQKVQAFPFSWNVPDPYKEQIGWNVCFTPMRERHQDTVHSIFRRVEHQKRQVWGKAAKLMKEGEKTMALDFKDPVAVFRDAFSVMLAPKKLADPDPEKQKLEFILDGQTLPFAALSSGELEAINIVFDFILRKPRDCVVFFDEPELHLHPELSYRLISTLQRFGQDNQFVLCTHSPDIISSSLEQSVVFLSPATETEDGEKAANQAIAVSETSETNTALRLLGHSVGIISLGKKIVLIEGNNASLDKQLYGSILDNRFPDIVLVPCGGKATLESFDVIAEQVLSKTLWGVEFFMLCDRDTMPFGQERTSDQLCVLNRYHLENYFLDEDVWAEAFGALEERESWLCSAAEVRAKIKGIAQDALPHACALSVASSIRREFGSIDVMPKECHNATSDGLSALFEKTSTGERARAEKVLSREYVKQAAVDCYAQLQDSLANDTEEWKRLIPGKQIVNRFASVARLSAERARRLYIKAAARMEHKPFLEIIEIFRTFAARGAGRGPGR